MTQQLIAALIVAGCAAYAAWALMPAGLRRTLARRMAHGPWPRVLARTVERAALAPTGCSSCEGCSTTQARPAAVQPIRIHRRPRP